MNDAQTERLRTNPMESGALRTERESRERARDEGASRQAAGLGFWRLVWIVALGILLAQTIAGIVLAVARVLAN